MGLSPAVTAGGDFGWHETHWDLRGKDTVSYSHRPGLHIRGTCMLQGMERSTCPSGNTWMLSAVRRARQMCPAFYSFPVNDCLFLNLSSLETRGRTRDYGQFIRANWASPPSSTGFVWQWWLPGDTCLGSLRRARVQDPVQSHASSASFCGHTPLVSHPLTQLRTMKVHTTSNVSIQFQPDCLSLV